MARPLTRRRFVQSALKGAAIAAAGVWLGPALPRTRAAIAAEPAPAFFTPAEAATISAACARIVPGSPAEPGASEIGAVRVIDFLCEKTPALRPLYRAGAEGLDQAAIALRGKAFAALPPAGRDEVLTAVQSGKAAGTVWKQIPSPFFFNVLQLHTKAACFTNPATFRLTGYPGVYDHARRKHG